MKKVFLFLSAISFAVLSSCSDDDNPTPPVTTTDVLVQRITMQQDDSDGFNYVIDYTYDGNKLLQGVYDDGTIEKYFYTGDQITKIEYIFGGVVEFRDVFMYDAQGRLSQYQTIDLINEFSDTFDYTYNSDNTISVSGSNYATITMQNGEISQIVHPDNTTYSYTYDTKNSPFKNVTGYAEIAYAFAGDFELHGRSKNIVSIVNETQSQNYTVNAIQYNADNYPTMVTSQAIFDSNFPNDVEELTTVYSY